MMMVKSYRGVADFAGCGESRWIGTYEAEAQCLSGGRPERTTIPPNHNAGERE